MTTTVNLTEKKPGDVSAETAQPGQKPVDVTAATAAPTEAPLAPVTGAAGAQPEPATQAPPAAPPQKPRDIVTMPQAKLDEIKRNAERKALQREAKQHGFDRVEDYRAHVAALIAKDRAAAEAKAAQQKPAPAEQPPAASPASSTVRAVQMQTTDQQKLEMMAREKAKAEKEARELRKQMEAMKGDMALKASAAKAGITADDSSEFALFLLRKHAETLSDEELDAFDPDVWFATLRTSRPHLFSNNPIIEHGSTTAGDGNIARQTTTSTGANPAGANAQPNQQPGAPPSKAAQQSADAPKVPNALEMNDEQFAEFRRKQGWSAPNGSTSYPTPQPRGGGQG